MKSKLLILLGIALFTQAIHANESVVLLHGLGRTSKSMKKMEKALQKEGYTVHNLSYPSLSATIEVLAEDIRERVVDQTEQDTTVHFVTHSMGGIILRQIEKSQSIPNLGRVVMLSPPNHGSEIVDKLLDNWLARKINIPAWDQLSAKEDGFIQQLEPVDFELGVITGDRSINWICSRVIPGKDDGKVSLESAKIEGMSAYKVVHATHTYIAKNKKVTADTLSFLKTGKLDEK